MDSKQQRGQQGCPGGEVQPPALTGVLQAAKQNGEDIHHEDRDATVQKDVDHVKAHGVEASREVVVNPESQDGERPVGLVAGVAAQSTAPEIMVPQVPKGRFCLEVLIVNNSF